MSLTSFTADMETIGGDVPTASRFISPQISAKETHDQFPPNGLTGRNQQEVYPKVNKNMNVIVFSEPAQSSAEALQDQMKKENHSVSLLCLKEPKDLTKINLDSVLSLYMMVDASLCDILFQRKLHRGLHPDVYDFLDEVEEKGRSITLFNRMDKGDSRFKKLYHHLPEKCATMVKEITFQTGKVKKVRKRLPKSIDSGIADITPTEGPNHNSAERASDSRNKVKDAPASEQPGNSYNRNAGPGGPGGDNQEDVTYRKVSSLMASAPVGSAASPGSSGLNGDESLEGGTEVMSEDKMELEQNDNESLSEGSAESDDEPDSIVEVNTVQIGYNQTLEVQWTAGQMVNASQEGWNNTIELNIVPPATKSKVIVVFTTNPSDERLDNLLVREFTDETELINVRVQSSDASNYKVWSGSVVMEIEVKPGVTIDKEYIEKLLKVIFSGKAGKVIPEGTKFGVDIQTKMVVPFEQLGKYVHLNPEKIHENCVSKEKYEERVTEVRQLQKRLVQGILKNPKQDQVLQNALKNFISSVLTDFAFAMTPESPALMESGSTQLTLRESGSSQQKLTESVSAQQKPIDIKEGRHPIGSSEPEPQERDSGLSQRVDSGYGEISQRKGSKMSDEHSGLELSPSTQTITRHGKWQFDVLLLYEENSLDAKSLYDFLSRHGFKCGIIPSFKLRQQHSLRLSHAKFVVLLGFDAHMLQLCLQHHRRVICLSDNFKFPYPGYLQQGTVLTFMNQKGKFWREKLLEQLGGSKMSDEYYGLEMSPSAQTITGQGKWQFDVLLVNEENSLDAKSLNDFLSRHGFKCGIIPSFKLWEQDSLRLSHAKFVVFLGFDVDMLQLCLQHHRRIICLIDNFQFQYLGYLQQGTVLTFMVHRGKFWKERLLEQLGVPKGKEHQSLREITFDEQLEEKTYELLDSVYESEEYRPEFLVKRNGPDITIVWTEPEKHWVGGMGHVPLHGGDTTRFRTPFSASDGLNHPIVILHTHADEEFASVLKNHLQTKKGYRCSLPTNQTEISQSLEKASIVIILVSKNSLEDGMFKYMMADKVFTSHQGKPIVPVVLDDAIVPQTLKSYTIINVREKLWQEKLTRFIDNAVEQKGDTFTIKWTEVEEKQRRKLFTIGSQEEEEESGKMKKIGEESTEMRKTDVKDVRKLAQKAQMSRAKKTEVDERYDAIAGKLSRLALDMHGTHPSPKDDVPLPEAIGRELASIGDNINEAVNLEEALEAYLRESNKAPQYEEFRSAVHDSLGSESSWQTIAMVMQATKNVLSRLGTSMAGPVRQLAQKFIQDECADFIIDQGGWEAVLDEEGSDFDID